MLLGWRALSLFFMPCSRGTRAHEPAALRGSHRADDCAPMPRQRFKGFAGGNPSPYPPNGRG